MAEAIPLALKQADANIYKCANRAGQLQAVKPIMAYWCEYWVVNQILARQLHTADPDILSFTTALMDKLEQTKAQYSLEDAIIDDTAGQAYVEQFAQETLDRAQRVVNANKVTAQTANTFDAAATFLNLINIWGPADVETQQKIKYAKWNAARIFKAIKEGRDPNESNPQPEEAAAGPLPPGAALDPSDPEVQMLASGTPSARPRPVTVEDAPDTASMRSAPGVPLPQSPTVAIPPSGPPQHQDEPVLPDAPPDIPSAPYFNPSSPPRHQPCYFDAHAPPPAPSMPSPMSPPLAPATGPPDSPHEWTPTPPPAAGAISPPPPEDHYRQAQPNPVVPSGPPTFAPSPGAMPAVAPPPISPPPPTYMHMAPNPSAGGRPAIPPPASAPAWTSASASASPGYHHKAQAPSPHQVYTPPPPPVGFVADDATIALAQKHAKWAISALNFEDVPTAVRELRKALQTLGAT